MFAPPAVPHMVSMKFALAAPYSQPQPELPCCGKEWKKIEHMLWHLQVEEQEAKPTPRSRPRTNRAASSSLAGPSSPAPSWDSGAGKQGKVQSPYATASQRYVSNDTYTASNHPQVRSWPQLMQIKLDLKQCCMRIEAHPCAHQALWAHADTCCI